MPDLRPFALKARNLKCFEDPQGFDSICPINLIVGILGGAFILLLLYAPFVWLTYRYARLTPFVRFLYLATAPGAAERFAAAILAS